MILILDPGDPFLGGLVQLLLTAGAEVRVRPADHPATDVPPAGWEGLVVASGPGGPDLPEPARAEISRARGRLPILGVGLGHLSLAALHGARIVPSPGLRHGRTSPVLHRGRGLFAGVENPFAAVRYDALSVEGSSLPEVLELAAWTPDGEVMALRHREQAIWGVQSPPQSILTEPGPRIVENFLTLCRQHKEVPR